MFSQYDSFTFFPATEWSHTWERPHELIYRFAKEINGEINIFMPLGLINHKFLSTKFVKKVLERHKKSVSTNNKNNVLSNMNFINSIYIPRFDPVSASVNFMILNKNKKLSSKNFFWANYVNPAIYKFFEKSMFRIIDLSERRQANMLLSTSMRELEKKAVSEADLVIVDSMATYDDYKALNDRIFYIPQGYDHNKIKRNDQEIKNRNKVGYIGNLHNCIDYEYLFKLIEINRHLEFVIVGGIVDNAAEKLYSFPNVEMIGQVPKIELQKYLDKISFGLIPYKINEFTKGVYPTKLFEYLGAGVPVISTPIPEVKQYGNNKFVFIESEPNLIKYKVDFNGLGTMLQENTWEKRFENYLGYIKKASK